MGLLTGLRWMIDKIGVKEHLYSEVTEVSSIMDFDKVQRFDGLGKSHINKITKQNVPTPHVNGMSIPWGVRPARPDEIPKKR